MGVFDQQVAAQLFDAAATLPWLQAQRGAARAAWLGGKMPTRKTEAWKYTTLDALAELDYLPALPTGSPDIGQTGAPLDGAATDGLGVVGRRETRRLLQHRRRRRAAKGG